MKEKVTLFKFWAPWCPHCRKVNTYYDKVIKAMEDKFDFEDIDTTTKNVLAERFAVKSVPTFILWSREYNLLLDEKHGEIPYEDLVDWLDTMDQKIPYIINQVIYGNGRKINKLEHVA